MSDYQKDKELTIIGRNYTWTVPENPPAGYATYDLFDRGHAYLLSQGNPYRNGHYTDGGKFISVKVVRTITPSAKVTVFRPGFGVAYKGSFVVEPPDDAGPNLGLAYINQRFSNLELLGSAAWNRMRPDLPDFSLATSLGELKDLPGMLKDAVQGVRKAMGKAMASKGKSSLSKTGQYYLAIQFGWLPILSDIQNFVKAHKNMQKRLDQLIRDNGKPIRRSITIEDNITVSPTDVWATYGSGYGAAIKPSFVTQCYATGPTFRRETYSTQVRTWAEGRFRYHLPPGPRTVAWKKKMLRRIMGSRVTPDTVYNLMPWSWLVDYFTDLGQFIKATSPGVADRLAADYAYLMRTSIWTATRTASGCYQASKVDNAGKTTAVTSATRQRVEKFRSRASPFGWGVKQSSLTTKQLAILGALGLSKLP